MVLLYPEFKDILKVLSCAGIVMIKVIEYVGRMLGNSVERYSQKVLNAWNAIQVERALSIYLQLYRDIRYSLSPVYELELAFSRLCWLSEFVSNAEVKKAIDAAQSLLRGVVPASTGVGTGTSAPGANTGTGAGTGL